MAMKLVILSVTLALIFIVVIWIVSLVFNLTWLGIVTGILDLIFIVCSLKSIKLK